MKRSTLVEGEQQLPPNVRLIPSEACLITKLASTLGNLSPEVLMKTQVVLPTKRLGTWLLSLLSQQKSAFFAPKISNLEQFIEQAAPPDAKQERGLSPLDEELVLADLIRSGQFRHLRLGHEHEVRQLFSEFADWSVGTDVFEQLHRTLDEDFTHADEAVQSLHERITELERLHGMFVATLGEHNCLGCSARRAKLSASLAAALRERWQSSSGQSSSRELTPSDTNETPNPERLASYWDGPTFIVGFTSLAACHADLFRALGDESGVELWITEPPELFGPRNPIALLLSYFSNQETVAPRAKVTAKHRSPHPIEGLPLINENKKAELDQLETKAPAQYIRVHRARSPLHEVSEALQLAKVALQAGHPAAQIALLVTSDSSYGKLIRSLSKKMGLEANLAIGTPLPETVLGSWCVGLFDLLSSNESVETMLSFLTHPLTFRAVKDTWQKAELSQARTPASDQPSSDQPPPSDQHGPETTLRHYRARMSHSLGSSQVHQGLETFRERCLDPSIQEVVDLICSHLINLRSTGRLALGVWQEHLAQVLNAFDVLDEDALQDFFLTDLRQPIAGSQPSDLDPGLGQSSNDQSSDNQSRRTSHNLADNQEQRSTDEITIDRGLERSTADYLAQFMNTLVHVAGLGSSRLTGPEFLRLTREKLLGAEVRSIGEPLAGLQVLSVSEARYVPFRLVIILGCTEGRFPQGLPKDHLLDNSLKSRIGLPGWQLLEAIEDTTFHLLAARLPVIEMFYPQREGNTLTVRSRFIERLLAENSSKLIEHFHEDALTAAFQVNYSTEPSNLQSSVDSPAKKSRLAPLGNLGSSFFKTYGPLRQTMSATALETLIGCPYRFLLAELGVGDVTLSKEHDPRQEGAYLHRVLEAFFTGRAAGQYLAEPLSWPSRVSGTEISQPSADEVESEITKRLTNFAQGLAPKGFQGSPIELQLRFTAWPGFVRHVMNLYRVESSGDLSTSSSPKDSGPEQEAKSRSAGLMHQVQGYREAPLDLAQDGAPITLSVGGGSVPVAGTIDAIDTFGPFVLITDYKRRRTPTAKEVTYGLAPQLVFYAMALDALYRSNQPASHQARATAEQALGGGTLLENQVLGYFSVKKGEFKKVAAGAAARGWAAVKGLGGSQSASLEEASEHLQRIWEWRLKEVADGTYRPDLSQCHTCNYNGICRRDDPQFAETRTTPAGLQDNERLAAYLDSVKNGTSNSSTNSGSSFNSGAIKPVALSRSGNNDL